MKIFISYAHEDIFYVKQLNTILQKAGLSPWFDEKIRPGTLWEKELYHEITVCEVFLYLLSPDSVESEWCMWELETAKNLEKPIIPILIKQRAQIPPEIKHIQYQNFTTGFDNENIARLLGAIFSTKNNSQDILTTIDEHKVNKLSDNIKPIISKQFDELFSWINQQKIDFILSSIYQFDAIIVISFPIKSPHYVFLFGFHDEVLSINHSVEELMIDGWIVKKLVYSHNGKTFTDNEVIFKYYEIEDLNIQKEELIEEVISTNVKLKDGITGRRILVHSLLDDPYPLIKLENRNGDITEINIVKPNFVKTVTELLSSIRDNK